MISDLNGRRASLTNATINIASETLLGAQEPKATETNEPGEVEGTSSIPVGYTDGPWSGTGSFKAPLGEAKRLIAALGPNFARYSSTATWTYSVPDSSDGVTTIEFPAFRITKVDLDGGSRTNATMIAFEFKLLQPALWDGVPMVEDDQTSLLAGFLLAATGFGG
jgi:hypothetical protein